MASTFRIWQVVEHAEVLAAIDYHM